MSRSIEFVAGHAGRDEDRQHHEQACHALGPGAAQREGDGQRDRCRSVTEVVDQVCEERDAAGGEVDQRLDDGGHAEHEQREPDGAQSLPRALDRRVDEPMGVAVLAVWMGVLVGAHRAPRVAAIGAGIRCGSGGWTCSWW